MLHRNFPKGASAHNHRIRRSTKQPHDEAIRRVESADIAAAGFPGDLETDHAVKGAHEVADDIRPIAMRWEPQITSVQNPQFLR